jgi:hypothetical protein
MNKSDVFYNCILNKFPHLINIKKIKFQGAQLDEMCHPHAYGDNMYEQRICYFKYTEI